jgi:Domain of unknown function (DUF4340)
VRQPIGRARLLLATFFALMISVVLINVARQVATRNQPTQPPPVPYLFPRVRAQDISAIIIRDNKDGGQITLSKLPGDWKATSKEGAVLPMNLASMPQILQALANLRYNSVIENVTDFGAFGLAESGLYTVQFKATIDYALRLGNTTPDGQSVYVWREGAAEGAVFVVSLAAAEPLVRAVESGQVAQPESGQP